MILNIVTSLKAVSGLLFIEAILKRTSLLREVFLLNIEIGLETVIPHELSQQGLPASFRFYDPILSIVKENISLEKQQIFHVRNKYNMRRIQDTDKKGEIMRILNGEEKKLSIVPTRINGLNRLDIDPWKSNHAKSL